MEGYSTVRRVGTSTGTDSRLAACRPEPQETNDSQEQRSWRPLAAALRDHEAWLGSVRQEIPRARCVPLLVNPNETRKRGVFAQATLTTRNMRLRLWFRRGYGG